MEVTETTAEAVDEASPEEEVSVVEASEETVPPVVTEELNDDGIEIVTEIVTLNDEEPTENAVESVTAEVDSTTKAKEPTSSESLDPSSITDLMNKNASGLMTQQDFFRVFLISVQNGLTTNQRLEEIERRLTDAEEKIKSTKEVPAVEAVEEPESVEEVASKETEVEVEFTEAAVSDAVEEAAVEETVTVEAVAEDTQTGKTVETESDESMDISSMVELAEKTRPSRKRGTGKVSQAGRASQSPIPSKARRTRTK